MKINIDRVIYLLICLFPVTTILNYFSTNINKLTFGLLILLIFLRVLTIFSKKINKKVFYKYSIFLVSTVFLVIYDYIITKKPLINFNDLLYLPFWILFLVYITNYFKEVNDNINDFKLMKLFIILGELSILFCLVINHNFFQLGRHRLASAGFLLLSQSLYAYLKTNSKEYLLYCIIPIITIVSCTSRTYVVMGLILLIVAYYRKCKKKSTFYLSLIPLVMCMLLILKLTLIWSYFEYKQVGNFDMLGSITSGRSIFWAYDMETYKVLNIKNQLFGSGYNLIYATNKKIFVEIYAHNDFINILFSNGILGLILYTIAFYIFIKKNLKNSNLSKIMLILLILICLFNAFFNGHYNYPCATISMIYIFLFFDERGIKKDEQIKI